MEILVHSVIGDNQRDRHQGKHAVRVLIELQDIFSEEKNKDKKNAENSAEKAILQQPTGELFSSNFIRDLDEGKFCDVEFVFNDGTPSFKAHKLILSR